MSFYVGRGSFAVSSNLSFCSSFAFKVIPASWLWLQSCITENSLCDPRESILFKPQPWPLISFDPSERQFLMSISQFEGHERRALIQLIANMGSKYSTSLSRGNTHLICKNPEVNTYWSFLSPLVTALDLFSRKGEKIRDSDKTVGLGRQGCYSRFPNPLLPARLQPGLRDSFFAGPKQQSSLN